MLSEQISHTAQLPERLRRLAGSMKTIEHSNTLRLAALRIRELEVRCGIKAYNRIHHVTRLTQEINGRLITLKEAVELYGGDGVSYNTASNRIYTRGWPLIEAIATPVIHRKGGGRCTRRVKTLTLRSDRKIAA